ncbi:MAG: alpha/beta hydrolase [Myxococcota bacterium]
MTAEPGNTAPPLALFFLEGQRAFFEGMTLPAAHALLRRAPRGGGQPVLLLPGYLTGDGSTRVLRRFLAAQGFRAHPWLQGRNSGPRRSVIERVSRRLAALHERYGEPVSLVGWSLGGVYAREIAKGFPDLVRQVVSLGSPFADITRTSSLTRWVQRGDAEEQVERERWAERLKQPPPVPSTAIFSKSDGIVHWRACRELDAPSTENIEVSGSHCGLGFNPLVLYLVAERLAQPEGGWKPFRYEGWRRYAYG